MATENGPHPADGAVEGQAPIWSGVPRGTSPGRRCLGHLRDRRCSPRPVRGARATKRRGPGEGTGRGGSEDRPLRRNARPTRVAVRARHHLFDHLQRRRPLPQTGPQRHSDGRQAISVPPGHDLGVVRFAHHESAADAKEGCRTLGHDGRWPEAAADHSIEAAAQNRIPAGLLGAAADHRRPGPTPRGSPPPPRERWSCVRLHPASSPPDQGARRPGPGPAPRPRCRDREHGRLRRGAPGMLERVPRGTRRRPGRGNPGPGRRRAVRSDWWSRRDDHDPASRILALGP